MKPADLSEVNLGRISLSCIPLIGAVLSRLLYRKDSVLIIDSGSIGRFEKTFWCSFGCMPYYNVEISTLFPAFGQTI